MIFANFDVGYNYTVALENWKSLAEQGNASAQYNLGLMYDMGQCVSQDYKQAVYWLTKSAKQGNAKAQTNLGFMCTIRDKVCHRILLLPMSGLIWERLMAIKTQSKAEI